MWIACWWKDIFDLLIKAPSNTLMCSHLSSYSNPGEPWIGKIKAAFFSLQPSCLTNYRLLLKMLTVRGVRLGAGGPGGWRRCAGLSMLPGALGGQVFWERQLLFTGPFSLLPQPQWKGIKTIHAFYLKKHSWVERERAVLFAWKFHLSVMSTCPSEQLVILLEALRFHTHPCRALLGDILVHALDFLDQPKG